MANSEHLDILKQGVEVWNDWKQKLPKGFKPDLTSASLDGSDLCAMNLDGVDLNGSELESVSLDRASLQGAELINANLRGASLRKAKLKGANLQGANLQETFLTGADFTDVILIETLFVTVNLSAVENLDTCRHFGPSILDTWTLTKSVNLPDIFLRGCGLSDKFIEFIPSLFQGQANQFYSCFISHASKDEDFTKRLHANLQDAGVRCWFDQEDIQGGKKLSEQIDSAIRLHDKLLLVLSEHSMNSEWVKTELQRCLKAEKKEGRRKLFPIRLVEYATLEEWKCFDSDAGRDLAVEVRDYFIPDFTGWKDHDAFQEAFQGLLKDLKEEAPTRHVG